MNKIFTGDSLKVLKTLDNESAQTCVTSPPYFGLRDYGMKGQIGLEETPEAYVQKMVELFREVRRVLRNDGTLWLNLGDSYATSTKGGNKSKPGDKTFTSKGTVNQLLRNLITASNPKTLSASRGASLSPSKLTAGISGRILSGQNQTPCPRA